MRKLASEFACATALYRYFPTVSVVRASRTMFIKETSMRPGWEWTLGCVRSRRPSEQSPSAGIAQFSSNQKLPAMRWMNAILRVLLDAVCTPSHAVRACHYPFYGIRFFVGDLATGRRAVRGLRRCSGPRAPR